MTGFPISRAWSGTCTDGWLRDLFVNAVAHRIEEENHDAHAQGYPPELVEDFVERCDALFEAASPEPLTAEAVDELAADIDTSDLYELVGEE